MSRANEPQKPNCFSVGSAHIIHLCLIKGGVHGRGAGFTIKY